MVAITVDTRNTIARTSEKYMRGEIDADELQRIERKDAADYVAAMLTLARVRSNSKPGAGNRLARLLGL